jgi:hypothetical protein
MNKPARVGGVDAWRGNERVVLAVGGVDQEVEASSHSEPELAFREEEFGKSVGINKGDDRAREAAPDGTGDTDGAEFVGVVGILVEGQKAAEGQVLSKLRRDLIVEEKGEEFGEGFEAFGVIRLVWGGQAKGFDGVRKIAKGAVGSAGFELGEGLFDNGWGDWDLGLVTGWFACACAVVDKGRLEGLAK